MTPTPLLEKARQLRADFPILSQTHPSGRPLIYFDNAATAQKPRVVIERLSTFLATQNANIHRGVHWLSQEATHLYEKARETVQHFLGAASPEEIIFVRGATEGINLIAQGLRRAYFQPGDEIILSTLEHHANIVPLAARGGGAPPPLETPSPSHLRGRWIFLHFQIFFRPERGSLPSPTPPMA
jgi:cysteine desulfurase/selenocysteine lyase